MRWTRGRSDDEIARRLRREAAAASVVPPPELYRRTLSALNAVRDGPRVDRPGRLSVRSGYVLACLTLTAISGLAAVLLRGPAVTEPVPRVPQRILPVALSWEDPLQVEARHVAADAQQAARYVMTSLGLPPMSGSQTR